MVHHPRKLEAAIGHVGAVVRGHLGRGDAAAIRADDLKGMPVIRPLRPADFLIDAAHHIGLAQDLVDGVVEFAGAIDVAHAIKLGPDAEIGEDAEELGDEVLGHVAGLGAGWRRDVAERCAQIFLEDVGLAVGDFIDRIVVVDAEEIAHGHAVALERAENRVVDERPAQRADMRAAGRRLRIVDRLRAGLALHQFIAPKHRAL